MTTAPTPHASPPRQVAVVSGKGGTGKTTITAVLAALSAPLVLADADVEASNLPLVFAGRQVASSPFPGLSRAAVDPARCNGCGICVDVCRFGAVRAAASGGTTPDIDPLRCEGCGVCVDTCPAEAIHEVPCQAGTLHVFRSSVGTLVSADLAPGEDLSGRLTTMVRQRAMHEAEREHLDLVLIDGPPGTGCPAIATITGADALIAVTEPTAAGAADLQRLVTLAARFQLMPTVIINKVDLSPQGAQELERACQEWGLSVSARLPFVPRLTEWLAAGARLEDLPDPFRSLYPVAATLRDAP